MSAGGIRSVLLVLALGTLCVACGSATGEASTRGSASTTEPMSSAEWRSELATACEELNSDFDDLPGASPRNRAEAVAYAERVDEFAAGMVAVLEDAAPAAEVRGAAQLTERVEDLAGATGELRAASEDGDAAAAEGATDQIVEIGSELNSAAQALGVEACGGF